MGKVEDFSKIIKVVTELTDVEERDILSKSRVQEVVDARWMVFYLMRCKGYSPRQISMLLLHPERTIYHAINAFPYRVKYSTNNLRNIFAIAQQQLL